MKTKSVLLIISTLSVLSGSALIIPVYGQNLSRPQTVDSLQHADSNTNNIENIFVVYSTGEDKQDFREYAEQMVRLKQFGRVDICINSPAAKSDFELPENSCDWHEYASYNRSVEAFFPDNKLIPFVPGEYIARKQAIVVI